MEFERACIYARTSSTGSQADRQHPDNQLGPLRTFATSQGWQVVQEFIDKDGGTKSDRPGFKAMMEAAGKHEFDHVVFWSLDRVTRNGALDALQILNKLTRWRVGYPSADDGVLAVPE